MKTFVKRHTFGAGKYIYDGYFNAWFNPDYFDQISDLEPHIGHEYRIMAVDADIQKREHLDPLAAARVAWVYVQPNEFPMPWGGHPNFVSTCPDEMIEELNRMDNVRLWTFGGETKYHTKWRAPIHSIPLAFDLPGYTFLNHVGKEEFEFDVAFIGGWADNGFNEKMAIMKEYFAAFKESNLRCGFSVNRGISTAQEVHLLRRSKVAINIHDAYQRKLGLDTNERTFKAIGVNGMLVSDEIKHIADLKLLTDGVTMARGVDEMVSMVREFCDMPDSFLIAMKEKNRKMIADAHTYEHRTELMRSLE